MIGPNIEDKTPLPVVDPDIEDKSPLPAIDPDIEDTDSSNQKRMRGRQRKSPIIMIETSTTDFVSFVKKNRGRPKKNFHLVM